MSSGRRILISGAGIAGPALAFWLARYGFETTLVERAPHLRDGGQAVDFRGPVHLRVLERMGLLETLRAHETHMGAQQFVDETGRRISSIPASFLSGDLEILRGDLARILHETTRTATTYLFGDSIMSLVESGNGVDVQFERAGRDRFDIVIGADGMHSQARALHFGREPRFLRHLGYYIAGFGLPNDFGLDHIGKTYSVRGRALHLEAASESVARAAFVFVSPQLTLDPRDQSLQKQIIERTFSGLGWEVPRALAAMQQARDLYFSAIARVDIPSYSRGRIALLGDAAYGGTVGGGGAGCAIVGAYVLAGELAKDSSYEAAFARYEKIIRPYATRCQSGAEDVGAIFAPTTRAKLWVRNTIFRALSASPRVSGWLNQITSRDASNIVLPDYP